MEEEMKDLVTRMCGSFDYRGPDGWGVWVDPTGTCALSHQRVEVLDASPTGRQPFYDHQSGATVVMDGRIYNYPELRAELVLKGHHFFSATDAEVLLKGLIENGDDFIDRCDGMFAFAFYNPQTKTLTLGRDIFGEKPLYCARTKDWFAFASELHALTILPGFDLRISTDAIATYLALQYLPAPHTIYHGAFKLPAAHTLKFSLDAHEIIKSYYKYKASPEQEGQESLSDLADEYESILALTLRERLRANVPLGAWLLPDTESALVAAIAAKQLGTSLKTFAVGFEGSETSRHLQARNIAATIRADHYEELLSVDALDSGRHICSVMDEPIGDSGCLPVWALARFTRKQATVILTGLGGKELMGDHQRYTALLKQTGSNANGIGSRYYAEPQLVFGETDLIQLLGHVPDKTADILSMMRKSLNQTDLPVLQRLRETDIQNRLPGLTMTKIDRMSMQHGLEVRSPMLARRLADFSMRLAADSLCTAQRAGRIVKEVASRYLADNQIETPPTPLSLPFDEWKVTGALLGQLETLFSDSSCCLKKWIEPQALKTFLEGQKRKSDPNQIWELYTLELWMRSHMHRHL